MRRWLCLPIALAMLVSSINAHADQPPVGVVQAFGPNLRSDCPLPEGLAVDPVGSLYVASVQSAPQGVICVVSNAGRLVDHIPVAPGPGAGNVALTGMLFSPGRGLYALDVADFFASGRTSQNGRLLRIDPVTHAATIVVGGFALPNGIAQDAHRNIYVSDSARGTIYRVTPGGSKTVWSQDSLISRHVNDLAFDGGHHFLYVVTTGSIVRIPLKADGTAGTPQVFADPSTINAPNFPSGLFTDDGIALDGHGNVFITAAATSEIFELSSEGQLISQYWGSGANVLDEPSALVFRGQNLYISNTSGADGGLHAGISVLRVLPQSQAAPGVLIHGQATDSSTNLGIQGINVNAVDAGVACCPFHSLSFTQTDANGNFRLLVPAGSAVKVQFFTFPPGSPPYLDQWWNNKADFDSADTLTVTGETFNINAALVRGVFVHGQVTDAASHAPIAGINVNAVDPSINCCPFHNLNFAQTDSGGSYQILVPAGSPVKLSFFSFGPDALPYFDQWWNNRPDFDTADTLTVSAETFHIDAALVRGAFIHGQVTDAATHAAIPGVNVILNDANVCCHGFAFAQTDSSGNYRILAPIGSPVKLHFATFGPNALPYFEQWWNNRPDFETADTLTVNVETFHIDVALVRGVFVHGQVTDSATHAAIAGINVTAVDPSVNCCPFHNVSFAQTDSSGTYRILVPPGRPVKIQFFSFGPDAPPYFEQWWNHKPDFDTADTLTVNVETFNVNAALTRGVLVHGRVTDAASHAAIAGMNVAALDGTVSCCRNLSFAQTDSNGDYQILAPIGSPMKLQFATFGPDALPYFEQWWNNKPDFDTADTLTVNVETFHIDVSMVRGVFIRGHVTDAASHVSLANINVSAVPPSAQFQTIAFGATDSNGNYQLIVHAASTVKIRFNTYGPGSPPYLEQWWNNKLDFNTADTLTVSVDTSNIDAAMVRGGVVSGHVTDSVTHAPVVGIGVEVFGPIEGCCGAATDANGNYQLVAPFGSSVRVSFASFDAGESQAYLRQWWNNKPTFDTADVIVVDGDKSGIDAALTPGFFVQGRVTDAVTHQPVAGIHVEALDASGGCCTTLAFGSTDSNGNYRLAVPKGALIKVIFHSVAGAAPYVEQWWNNKPTFDTADTLTINVETFGIDAALVPV